MGPTVTINKEGVLTSYTSPGCDTLYNVTIPDDVTEIGQSAACHSNLARVGIPGSVSAIRAWAFACCDHLKRVDIQEGTSRIGTKAFYGCNELTQVYLPESVAAIAADAFKCCPHLVIHAPEGSYAERYARKAGIPVRTRKVNRRASA